MPDRTATDRRLNEFPPAGLTNARAVHGGPRCQREHVRSTIVEANSEPTAEGCVCPLNGGMERSHFPRVQRSYLRRSTGSLADVHRAITDS
jgi:hypothetical protein